MTQPVGRGWPRQAAAGRARPRTTPAARCPSVDLGRMGHFGPTACPIFPRSTPRSRPVEPVGRGSGDLDERLVGVAPNPVLAGFEGLHDGVADGSVVLRRVLAG